MNQQEQIRQWFLCHQAEIVETLSSFVSVPSVTCYNEDGFVYGKQCHRMMDVYQRTAEQMGFKTERYEDDAVVVYDSFDPRKKTVGIWTHLDVVPSGDDWQTDPFVPQLREGYLIGRGSDDNKSAAAGALYILRCLRELQIELDCNVKIFAGCDEECGSLGIAKFVSEHECPDFSLVPDCGFPVCYGEKGIMKVTIRSAERVSEQITELRGGSVSNMIPDSAFVRLRSSPSLREKLDEQAVSYQADGESLVIRTSGIAGHAAFPARTVNAIDRLLSLLDGCNALQKKDREIFSSLHRLFSDNEGTEIGIAGEDAISGKTTCVGTVLSLHDRQVYLEYNIRYHITAKGSELQAAIEESCRRFGYELFSLNDSQPNYFDPNHPVVKELTRVYQEITGESREPYVMSGGTYARKIPNAVGFGIGGMARPVCPFLKPSHGGAHQPDEVLHLESYREALLLFVSGLIAIAPVVESGEKKMEATK